MQTTLDDAREFDRRVHSERLAREAAEAAVEEWEANPLSDLAERYSEGEW